LMFIHISSPRPLDLIDNFKIFSSISVPISRLDISSRIDRGKLFPTLVMLH
jgi:hypothetical protein